MGEVAAFTVEVLDEREDLLLHMRQHLFGLHLLEVAPAKSGLVDGSLLLSVVGQKVFAKEAGCIRVPREFSILLTLEIKLIQLLHEQQVSNLFNSRERIRYSTGPKTVPEFVYEAFEG